MTTKYFLPDGRKVILSQEKLDELFQTLNYKSKPFVRLHRLDNHILGEISNQIIDIDPVNVNDFCSSTGFPFSEEMSFTLAHEIGHFYNINYAKGFIKIMEWLEEKFHILLTITRLLDWAIIFFLVYLAFNKTINFSLGITALIILCVSSFLVDYSIDVIKKQNEKNADQFAQKLIEDHLDILNQCFLYEDL